MRRIIPSEPVARQWTPPQDRPSTRRVSKKMEGEVHKVEASGAKPKPQLPPESVKIQHTAKAEKPSGKGPPPPIPPRPARFPSTAAVNKGPEIKEERKAPKGPRPLPAVQDKPPESRKPTTEKTSKLEQASLQSGKALVKATLDKTKENLVKGAKKLGISQYTGTVVHALGFKGKLATKAEVRKEIDEFEKDIQKLTKVQKRDHINIRIGVCKKKLADFEQEARDSQNTDESIHREIYREQLLKSNYESLMLKLYPPKKS